EEDPHEHRERERRHELARLGMVNDVLGLVVDHVDQDLDRGLEAARYARGRLAGGAIEDEQEEHAERDREQQRIEVERPETVTNRQVPEVMHYIFGGVCRTVRDFGAHERPPTRFQNRGDRANQNTASVATNATNRGKKASLK